MNSYNNFSSVIFQFLKGKKNLAPAVIAVVAGLWGAASPVNQIGLSSAPPISRKPGLWNHCVLYTVVHGTWRYFEIYPEF